MLRIVTVLALLATLSPTFAVEYGHPNHLHGDDSVTLDAGVHDVTCQKITRLHHNGHINHQITLTGPSVVTCYHGKLTIEPEAA